VEEFANGRRNLGKGSRNEEQIPRIVFFFLNLVRNLILRTKFSFVGGKKCNSRAKFLYFDLFLK